MLVGDVALARTELFVERSEINSSVLAAPTRFEASGQFVAEFCHAEGVSVPNFYRWRKILSEANIAPVKKSEFIELGGLALSPDANALVPEAPDSPASMGHCRFGLN